MLKSCIPKDRDYEFFEAGDGLAGLEMFKQVNPDVTFMDLTMPVMDGITSLREILKVDDRAIVIVSTADVQMGSLSQALASGAYLVLRKPPTKESIEDALRMAEESRA